MKANKAYIGMKAYVLRNLFFAATDNLAYQKTSVKVSLLFLQSILSKS